MFARTMNSNSSRADAGEMLRAAGSTLPRIGTPSSRERARCVTYVGASWGMTLKSSCPTTRMFRFYAPAAPAKNR